MNYLAEYQKQLGLVPDGVIGPKTAAAMMQDLAVKDKLLFAHVLSQMAHESQGFTHARENLNYNEAGLLNIFRRYYQPHPGLATKHARKPEKIANYVYANRMGNGSEASGDGWKYRGIFGLQLTGKTNIQAFIAYLGLPLTTDPESLLSNPKNYFLSGFFWFTANNVAKLCTSTDEACVTLVSYRVNGGSNGLPERINEANKLFKTLKLV